MTPSVVFVLGFSAVLAIAAIGVSLFAVWRSQALVETIDERARVRVEELQTAVDALQTALNGQAAQLKEVEYLPPPTLMRAPRAGLNLGKRSQVLRMHRNGDAPDRIAGVLEVARQEVDLLIKVHRIVLATL
jgi:hypothetical protein